jgi:methionyl-tRNA formyltransferase
MKKISDPISFFGSGPVAAKSLLKLSKDFNIEAVFTKPRPPHHQQSMPVIDVANQLTIKTYTPKNKLELENLFNNISLKSQVGIVIDYGIIIPDSVINYFPNGIINSHFSLLPKYKGPDPISFAILNGDQQTGVSLMKIVANLDEGPLIAQTSIKLTDQITGPELTEMLIDLSHKSLKQYLPKYLLGQIKPYPQKTDNADMTRKLVKDDGILNFNLPAIELERQIRAFTQWPKSRTLLANQEIIVTKAHVIQGKAKPGSLYIKGKHEIGFFTKKDILVLDKIKPIGRVEMSASAFLAGYKFNI